MKYCRTLISLVLLITFSIAARCFAQAQQAPKPAFTLDFPDGSNAKNTQGQEIPARMDGKFIVQDSPHGKAMLSGSESGYLYFLASADIRTWKPGEWRFISETWSPSQTAIYVAGKLVGNSAKPLLPSAITGEIETGDDPWHQPLGPRKSQSLVADVRIYNHALSAEHIAVYFSGDYNKMVPLTSRVKFWLEGLWLSIHLSHAWGRWIFGFSLPAPISIGGKLQSVNTAIATGQPSKTRAPVRP